MLLTRLALTLLIAGQSAWFLGHHIPPVAQGGGGSLVQQANMVFVGAWRLPSSDFPPGSGEKWDYGGWGLGFDATACTNGGLFSQNNALQIAESCIPPVANWSSSATLSALPVATMAQNFLPAMDDYANDPQFWAPAAPQDTSLSAGDCKPFNAKLYCVMSLYYDGNNDQNKVIWTRSFTLTVGSFSGFVRSNPNGFSQSNTQGASSQHPMGDYLVPVPAEYTTSLGKMLAGGGGRAIVSTTSLGPSAFTFDPNAFTFGSDLPATALLWYNGTHPNVGVWDPRPTSTTGTTPSDKPYHWTGDSNADAAVIPTGWGSLLVFGRGTGNFCYGDPTTDPAQDGVINPTTGNVYCYDTLDSGGGSKGTHSSDHHSQVWAYDLNDLISVKAGTKNPYDVLPYALWDISIPTGFGSCTGLSTMVGDNEPIGAALGVIGGTEYLFLTFRGADYGDQGCRPLIGAFKVQ